MACSIPGGSAFESGASEPPATRRANGPVYRPDAPVIRIGPHGRLQRQQGIRPAVEFKKMLFDPANPNSMSSIYREMSYGNLEVTGEVIPYVRAHSLIHITRPAKAALEIITHTTRRACIRRSHRVLQDRQPETLRHRWRRLRRRDISHPRRWWRRSGTEPAEAERNDLVHKWTCRHLS